jgi:phosphoribosylformylglycinamidine synthase
MTQKIQRIFVEKPDGFNIEARKISDELKKDFQITGLEDLRIIHRYDTQGLEDEEYEKAVRMVFSEPNVDVVYRDEFIADGSWYIFAVEYLPGQFDQRADSAAQCLQLITGRDKPVVIYAKVIMLRGSLSAEDIKRIKGFFINPVESREASLSMPKTLDMQYEKPDKIRRIDGFITMGDEQLFKLIDTLGLAMSLEDIFFCRAYFRDEEKRDPSYTEIRVIDTYWSDHCRHTTFLTRIEKIEFEPGSVSSLVEKTYEKYLRSRDVIYSGKTQKPVCLMDIATIAAKHLKKQGMLDDLDESEEINACSIRVDVKIDDRIEQWLLMFKNETHNHPTEIEPFGGAATCLGGAIRDPLSGRAYVYQAMRVTGCGDPNVPVDKTLPGKLPQRTITRGAAHGYSSYGNQIGLATGQVHEIYDEGYVAKRMEIGAVIGAVPAENVRREKPVCGDAVILLGGRTGRDGCGGATGSSKEHDAASLASCGAEVQKGNAPTERKIQRLFRKPEVTRLIKKCNDFGAGGVRKYEGLDGTELAISESQERMAVVVDAASVERFIKMAQEENLEASVVAKVTGNRRMRMYHMGDVLVDLGRDFLDSNGALQFADVKVKNTPYHPVCENLDIPIDEFVKQLSVCSQKGLAEMFDSTIGAGTVLMPFGGRYQLTPEQGMAALLPAEKGTVKTASLMTFGYDPYIFKKSPFHGAICAVVESVSKIVAMGADHKKVRLTFQEYFEKLFKDPLRWGKPFSALLGAYHASMELGIPAIGGKDSMSGTFMDMDVPPTLVSFAVAAVDVDDVLSSEFKHADSNVFLLCTGYDKDGIIDFSELKNNFEIIRSLIRERKALSIRAVTGGGILEAVLKMSFGNKLGFSFENKSSKNLTRKLYGSFIIESDRELVQGAELIGRTCKDGIFILGDQKISVEKIISNWAGTLENTFPTKTDTSHSSIETITYQVTSPYISKNRFPEPEVFIPVFPGTNCEYDTKKQFEEAGAKVNVQIFRNLDSSMIKDSVEVFRNSIRRAQIIMIPGGFSAGDEPEGSGKFIATVFRNDYIKEAANELLESRDGLILGICNGFQALIKLGLLPGGSIGDLQKDSPTLTVNDIGRHASCMVRTRISSNRSPWLGYVNPGEVYTIPVSHGEGRFHATKEVLESLISNAQIATQYVDGFGDAVYDTGYNPNGSTYAIEGILSADGRIFGKMGHCERIGHGLYKNIQGEFDMKIFKSGVEYFKI